MSESIPSFEQLTEMENDIIDLECGLTALGAIAQDAVERDPGIDHGGLFFIERSCKTILKSLREKFNALHDAASQGNGDGKPTNPHSSIKEIAS